MNMEIAHSRKRLRRDTRSCYECRKRKVKCQLIDEKVDTCAECVKTGAFCTTNSPDLVEGPEPRPAHDRKQDANELRLERIEALLKRLVGAQEQMAQAQQAFELDNTISASFWDNSVPLHAASEAFPPFSFVGSTIPQPPVTQDLKHSLVALLPSMQDAATIVTSTTAWLWGPEKPEGSVLSPSDTFRLLDTAAVAQGTAMQIANALLLFALYMQQLPVNFDAHFLESQNVEKTIQLTIERVKMFILPLEDEACSLEGIESLTLLSLLHLNDGAIRKAWITFRRTLDVSRLNGLQDSFSSSKRNTMSAEAALRRRLWLSTVCGDCYCSLLLGLEPGIGANPFGPDDPLWNDPLADDEANVQRRICLIAIRVATRNASGLSEDENALREVEEGLNQLHDSVAPAWWRSPLFGQAQSSDSAQEPNRLICQFWFFQLRIFAHLPIAFGKPRNGSSCSLRSCIETSRTTLHRYLGLQHAKAHFSRCRAVDQSVFLAAVVLLLSTVQTPDQHLLRTPSRYDSDRALIEQVNDNFDAIGTACRREIVAKDITRILSIMLDITAVGSWDAYSTGRDVPGGCSSSNTIPGESKVPTKGASRIIRSGMGEIIACSVQPMLDRQSPASRLIQRMFGADEAATDEPSCNREECQEKSESTLEDLADPIMLQ